jgi:type II secretory pathway predicted ATPase ExeA
MLAAPANRGVCIRHVVAASLDDVNKPEAAARITWTISEKTLGGTGEVGTEKTAAARAELAAVDATRHTVIYVVCVANPALGVRGIHRLGRRPHTAPRR